MSAAASQSTVSYVPPPPSNAALSRGMLPGMGNPRPCDISLVAWVDDDFAPRKRLRNVAATVAIVRQDVRLFAEFFRWRFRLEPTLDHLTESCIEDFGDWHLARPGVSSKATANRSMTSLTTVWKDAATRGLCNPPQRPVRKFKLPYRMPDAWTGEQFSRILTEARDGDWRWERPRQGVSARDWSPPPVPAWLWLMTVVQTLYETSLRINALLRSPVERLDLATGRLFVPGDVQKNHADQVFTLPADVVDLWQRLDVHGRGLLRLGDDWPYDRHANSGWKTLRRWFRRMVVAAGFAPTRRNSFHKLRRTGVTYVAAAYGIDAACKHAGHASTSTTKGYIDPRMLPSIDVAKALPRPQLTPPDVIPLRRAE